MGWFLSEEEKIEIEIKNILNKIKQLEQTANNEGYQRIGILDYSYLWTELIAVFKFKSLEDKFIEYEYLNFKIPRGFYISKLFDKSYLKSIGLSEEDIDYIVSRNYFKVRDELQENYLSEEEKEIIKISRELESTGLSQDEINKYFDKYFEDKNNSLTSQQQSNKPKSNIRLIARDIVTKRKNNKINIGN